MAVIDRWALTDRQARGILLALGTVLGVAVLRLDVPQATSGQFWSDGATYHAMAWSLAADHDLRYEARDVFRVRREFPGGPQGIFLKRTEGGLRAVKGPGFSGLVWGGGDANDRIFFAKAMAYPLVAAPFVRAFGTSGLLVVNVLAWLAGVLAAYAILRRALSALWALGVTLALFGITVAPLYLLWMTPEMFNLGVIAVALAVFRKRPLLSAFLFGVATYSKPYNLFVALPLGAAPFVPWLRGQVPFLPALGESLRRGGVLLATAVALFALNFAVTGEVNYQGGERKTFYGLFPFEARPDGTKVTFGNSGQWMTTDHLGPLVEGRDEDKESRRTGPLRPPEEIRASFLRNLGYFWVGRFGGVLGYFIPALVAAFAFLAARPRSEDGWLALAGLGVSWLFYIYQIPDNWYGGGGTVGNRYFLNLLPLTVFLLPAGRAAVAGAAGVVTASLLGLALFLAPLLVSPVVHSLNPGRHATGGAFRWLPAELTMLNDLSVFTEPWRKKQVYGFMGDPVKHWPADPTAYTLYFMDDGTRGKETHEGRDGFRMGAGAHAEVIVRALDLKPVRRILVEAQGGPAGDRLSCRLAGETETLTLAPGQSGEMAFSPSRGFPYYETFLYVLECRSDAAAPAGSPPGSFLVLRLDVGAS